VHFAYKALNSSNSKILSILKQNESGLTVPDLCREHGVSNAAFYKWLSKFGGMYYNFIDEAYERA